MKNKKNATMVNLLSRFEEDTKISYQENNLLMEDKLKEIIDFSILDEITPNIETKKLLEEYTIKLLNIQANSTIALGMIFTEIYDKLALKGSENGVYEKWLSINNFNKTTAWRYRQRYMIYNSVSEEKKAIVAILPQNIIKEIHNLGIEESVGIINNSENKEKIIEFFTPIGIIENKRSEKNNKDEVEIRDYDFIFKKIEEKKCKIDELEEEKRKELNKYLKKIEEILS